MMLYHDIENPLTPPGQNLDRPANSPPVIIDRVENAGFAGAGAVLYDLGPVLRFGRWGIAAGIAWGFMGVFSAVVGSMALRNNLEDNEQITFACVGGLVVGSASTYLLMLPDLIELHNFDNNVQYFSRKKLAVALLLYLCAAISAVPVGALILPDKKHLPMGVMLANQMVGWSIVALMAVMFHGANVAMRRIISLVCQDPDNQAGAVPVVAINIPMAAMARVIGSQHLGERRVENLPTAVLMGLS